MNNSQNKCPLSRALELLTAHENKSVYERCWLELAKQSVKMAFSRNDIMAVNRVLMSSPAELRHHLVSWFKRLGIEVTTNAQTKGGWRAKPIEDRSKQTLIFQTMDSIPLRVNPAPSSKDASKRWFDDREQEERGQSIRAYQGGKASGK